MECYLIRAREQVKVHNLCACAYVTPRAAIPLVHVMNHSKLHQRIDQQNCVFASIKDECDLSS